MAYQLRVSKEVLDALSVLATTTEHDETRLLQQWADAGFMMPSFGETPARGTDGEPGGSFTEAVLLQKKYGRNASAVLHQVGQLQQALIDLATVAGKIRDAYQEAEHDQVQATADLNAALTIGLAKVNQDLAAPGSGALP